MKHVFWIILFLQTQALARRPTVPLLPPRDSASVDETSQSVTARQLERLPSPRQFGFEVGTLGRSQSSKSDALGLQLFYGARLAMRFRPWPYFYVRPSLGYFRKQETEGNVTVGQNVLEAGLGTQYALYSKRWAKFMVGIHQRLDAYASIISIGNESDSASFALRYRLGPSAGAAFRLGDQTSFTLDGEYTFGVTSERRHIASFTAGFLFDL